MTRDGIAAIAMGVLAAGGILCGVLLGKVPGVLGARAVAEWNGGKLPETADDLILGKKDAPIQIVEYASMTCPHCAAAHHDLIPELKSAYIDTGKVRLVFREYPLDSVATMASMAARCRGKGSMAETVAYLFERQSYWAAVETVDEAITRLAEVMREANMNKDEFVRCTQDVNLLKTIRDIAVEGQKRFHVDSTPTFFINGEKYSGELSFKRFESILVPLLPKN